MSERSVHRKIDWTPEDRARHKAIREKFQRERPTPRQWLGVAAAIIGLVLLGLGR